MSAAIFLDRDGVIIENRSNYVREWGDVELIPSAVQALAQYSSSPFRFVLVTNQSAVGRGIISMSTAQAINERIVAELKKNGCCIDGVFMCPHKPEDNCTCRKPKPGLLLQAANLLSIDLSKSLMIGDAWTDLQAGFAVGIPTLSLVLTGRGEEQLKLKSPSELVDAHVYFDLFDALHSLLNYS
jgi:D-glycero-D-manno-heptose 1,7-bisphosphate phosphatase